MQLDTTSFILEIINFLVLAWLLTRFLYRPVQAAIDARRAREQAAQDELAAARTAIDGERARLAAEQAEIAARRDATLAEIAQQVDEERKHRLAALDGELADARTRGEARLAAQEQREAAERERSARARAEVHLRGYLGRLACAGLEGALIDLFLADLAALSDTRRRALANTAHADAIEIRTVFGPIAAQRASVETAVAGLLGYTPRFTWRLDPSLSAGLAVLLGGHLLEVSLARTLDAFSPAESEP